jgi:hypothetical protein
VTPPALPALGSDRPESFYRLKPGCPGRKTIACCRQAESGSKLSGSSAIDCAISPSVRASTRSQSVSPLPPCPNEVLVTLPLISRRSLCTHQPPKLTAPGKRGGDVDTSPSHSSALPISEKQRPPSGGLAPLRRSARGDKFSSGPMHSDADTGLTHTSMIVDKYRVKGFESSRCSELHTTIVVRYENSLYKGLGFLIL